MGRKSPHRPLNMRSTCKVPLQLPYQQAQQQLLLHTRQNNGSAPIFMPRKGARLTLISAPYYGEKVTSFPLKNAVQLHGVTTAAIPASTTTTTTTTTGPAPILITHKGVRPNLMSKPHDGGKSPHILINMRHNCKDPLPLP